MIEYRTLSVDEAQGFLDLLCRIDDETEYMLYEPGERREKAGDISMAESIISASLKGGCFLLVAEDCGKLVGFILARRGRLNRIAHSAGIGVGILRDYRNKGIGTEFFRRLDVWAAENSISRLELTVICENGIARRLYEKSGFETEGIKRRSVLLNGRFLDEYYMAKIIE